MYSRLRLDISTCDLLRGLSFCLRAWRRQESAEDAVRVCLAPDEWLVCLSVRSGFDLLLRALALPAGSEVLVSAVTHPDLVRIIEGHGLRAVPLDLDLATLAPRTELLKAAHSSCTRAVLVAHLFGGRVNLQPVADFARRHDLVLIEDYAQSFRGPQDPGDPLADVSMFSFGPIKTATALGGGLIHVRNPDTLRKMRNEQLSWPMQRRSDYFIKLLKFLCLTQLTRPVPYRLLFRTCVLLGKDFDTLVNGTARTFHSSRRPKASGSTSNRWATADPLSERIRHQASTPLLGMLAHRLRSFDAGRLASRARVGEEIARRLSPAIIRPGGLADSRTHWLFPIIRSDPDSLILALRREGIDAARATSNICVIEAPPDRPEFIPTAATRMMRDIVFLPVYPELPEEALERLTKIVNQAQIEGPEQCA